MEIRNQPIEPDDSIEVFVSFRPTTERIPYGECPLVDSFCYNFTTASGLPNNNTFSKLEGVGILPKIATTNFTFPNPVLEGNSVNSDDYDLPPAQINSVSFTSALKIRKVRKLTGPGMGHPQDFEFDEISTIMSLTRLQDPPLPSSTHYINNIVFTPSSTTPTLRRCYIEVESDAAEGPDLDPIKYDTIVITGYAFDEGFEAMGIQYGTITRCQTPTAAILISNLSTTNELEVLDIVIDEPLDKVAVRLTDISNLTISPGGHAQIQYRFEGCDFYDFNGDPHEGFISISAHIKTNVGDTTVTITATPLIVPVNITTIWKKTTPGDKITIPFTIDLAQKSNAFLNFHQANITCFEMVLKVNRNELFFDGTYSKERTPKD
jgi:hypothetical protein